MAWIKVDHGLPQRAEVERMAISLGVHENEVVGALVRLWAWYSDETEDGAYRPASDPKQSLRWVDRKSQLEGVGAALREEGWLDVHGDGTVSLPAFDVKIGSAKAARKREAAKKARQRAAKNVPGDVPGDVGGDSAGTAGDQNAECRTQRADEQRAEGEGPRPAPTSKRRASKITRDEALDLDIPSSVGGDAFRPVWTRWVEHLFERTSPTRSAVHAHLAKLGKLDAAQGERLVDEAISANSQGFPAWAVERARGGGARGGRPGRDDWMRGLTLTDQEGNPLEVLP